MAFKVRNLKNKTFFMSCVIYLSYSIWNCDAIAPIARLAKFPGVELVLETYTPTVQKSIPWNNGYALALCPLECDRDPNSTACQYDVSTQLCTIIQCAYYQTTNYMGGTVYTRGIIYI